MSPKQVGAQDANCKAQGKFGNERGGEWSPKSLSSCSQLLKSFPCNIPANGPCLPHSFPPGIFPQIDPAHAVHCLAALCPSVSNHETFAWSWD